jgi:hypothetical protein
MITSFLICVIKAWTWSIDQMGNKEEAWICYMDYGECFYILIFLFSYIFIYEGDTHWYWIEEDIGFWTWRLELEA